MITRKAHELARTRAQTHEMLSMHQQHTLRASFLVNERTVAGSDRISGMETLHKIKSYLNNKE
jgi:hypothetical protein